MSTRSDLGSPVTSATAIETTTMVDGGTHRHRRVSWAAIFGGIITSCRCSIAVKHAGPRHRADSDCIVVSDSVWLHGIKFVRWLVQPIIATST